MKTNRNALVLHRVRLFTFVLLLGFVTVLGASLAERAGARWSHYVPNSTALPVALPPLSSF